MLSILLRIENELGANPGAAFMYSCSLSSHEWTVAQGDKWLTSDLYHHDRVPHLCDGLIVDKVGHFRGSENPDTLTSRMPLEPNWFNSRGSERIPEMGIPQK